ncbi:MAG: type II secretion system secretin GspD [Deltaproteobacteria bacterium]|nr:type II secretion system secretin GspD [Deltaproteobacteria bacterium]
MVVGSKLLVRAPVLALALALLPAERTGAQQNGDPGEQPPAPVIQGATGIVQPGSMVRPALPGPRLTAPGLSSAAQAAQGQGQTPPVPVPAPVSPAEQPPPPPPPPPSTTTPVESPVPEEAQLQSNIDYEPMPSGQRFQFNLQDVDLPVLVRIISNITGRRFILGAKARSIKATIFSPDEVTAGEAYRAFLAVLAANGMTVVPSGRYWVITESAGAAQESVSTYRDGETTPTEARMVTRIHRLENVSAEEMANLLNRFKSRDGDITPYPPTNTLIITDFGNNVQRLLLIVQELDVAGTGERIWVEPVHYADAEELAQKIQEVFEASGIAASAQQGGNRRAPVEEVKYPPQGGAAGTEERVVTRLTKVIADPRTNSLVIVATEPAYLQVLELIRRLDVPVAGEGEIHVHPLQHADAEELAGVLNSLATGGGGRIGGRPGMGAPGAPGGGEALAGEVRIQADTATNSLVIVSSPRDYAALSQVIQQLDIPRRQVFVEAVIMEVSLERLRNVGLSFHGGDMVDTAGQDSLVYGGFYPLETISVSADALQGMAVGIRGFELAGSDTTGLAGTGVSIPAFGVLLHALQTDNDVNVLSTPNILATDNVPAEIMVGGNIPVQQGGYGSGLGGLAALAGQAGGSSASSLLGGLNPFVSVGYQKVGITLKITPQINESDQVSLEIELEVSEVTGESSLGPIIGQKTAHTTSVVRDQQTVVIGGLMTDSEVETVEKVPFLGDIPILGYLFRHTRTRTTKRNLLIFLTPYIIRDPSDFRRIFNRKMEERRAFIEEISALREREWSPDIDYSRTNGLLEDINQTIEDLEVEEDLQRQMEAAPPPAHVPSEPISTESWSTAAGDTYVEIGPGGAEQPVIQTAPGQFAPSPGMTAPAPVVIQPQPAVY